MYRRSVLAAALAGLPSVALAGPQPVLRRPYVVAIDPGHGGDNSGCAAPDLPVREKDVTLAMALELRAAIGRRLPHATVVLIRDGDSTVPLAERVAAANAAGADLMLSLHANASPTRTQRGFETYVLDARASTLDAANTARRENAASPDSSGAAPDSPARRALMMLRELQLGVHRHRAARLAHAIQNAQAQRFPDRPDRGVKQAPFDVLMGARMPAVLFEAAFLDHPADRAALLAPSERAKVVEGLVEAIVQDYRESGR